MRVVAVMRSGFEGFLVVMGLLKDQLLQLQARRRTVSASQSPRQLGKLNNADVEWFMHPVDLFCQQLKIASKSQI